MHFSNGKEKDGSPLHRRKTSETNKKNFHRNRGLLRRLQKAFVRESTVEVGKIRFNETLEDIENSNAEKNFSATRC